MSNEKQALLPGLISGSIGAMASPTGRRGEGAIHGGAREIGTLAGAGAGGTAGALAGLGIGAGLSTVAPEGYGKMLLGLGPALGALTGAGLGGYGGYHAGAGVAKGFTGKKAPWQDKKNNNSDSDDEKKKEPSEKEARTWADWADDTNDDRTMLGFRKTDARIQHDANVLRQRNGDLPVDAKLNPRMAKATTPVPAPSPTPTPAPAMDHYMNAGLGAAGGAAAGAMLSRKNKFRNALIGAALGGAGTYAGSHLAHGGNLNTMLAGLGLGGKTATDKSAFDFGKMLGDAGTYAKDLYNKIPEGVRSGIGMGGLGGAALGGLAGLMSPGVEDVFDEEGNVIGRKRRGRFGAALRGALGGGVLGAGAGAAAGHFAPNHVQGAMNYVQNRGADMHDAIFGKRMDGLSQIQGRSLPQTGAPGMPQAGMA